MTVNGQTPIFQLRIDLKGISPPIWRRVLVPADATLDNLHDIIQAVMPWWDAHLHEFERDGVNYGIPNDDNWYPVVDSRTIALREVLPNAGVTINYQYDFGDSWDHKIRLEKVLDPDPDIVYPVCTKGKRACPPEDCGGIHGYMYMLEVMKDPKNDEYETYLDWLDDDFDPEAFDLEEANDGLHEMNLGGPDSLPGELQPVPRVAVLLKPRQPLIEWVRARPQAREISSEAISQTGIVILVPIPDSEEEFEEYFSENLPTWIATMFSIWDEDEDIWPDDEKTDLSEWIDLKMYPLVFDAALEEEVNKLMSSGLGQMLGSMLGEMDENELGNILGLS